MNQQTDQSLVIVGAGPAGLAPLFAAACAGELAALLRGGVTILERSTTVGSGALDGYGITSDSAAEAFLDVVVRTREPRLAALRAHPAAEPLLALGKDAVPLQAVAAFLQVAGQTLCEMVAESPRCHVITGASAIAVRQTRVLSAGNSRWETRFVHTATGIEQIVRSHSVVLATGAHQPIDRLRTEKVAGTTLLPHFAHKLLQSSDLLSVGGATLVAERLRGRKNPKVVVVGGSTSAGAVATTLLDHTPGVDFGEGGVTILHRRPLRIFYETADEALADGYTEFLPEDVCRLTGRVFRLSGFRLESRALILRARGIGGRPREARLALFPLVQGEEAAACAQLEQADLIVAALGYQAKMLPVKAASGRPIPLLAPRRGAWAVIDQRCRALTSDGQPLAGLFAIGLSVGPAASEELGGEHGFQGQVNSLWLWQHTLGLRIVNEILSEAEHDDTEDAEADDIVGGTQRYVKSTSAGAAAALGAGGDR